MKGLQFGLLIVALSGCALLAPSPPPPPPNYICVPAATEQGQRVIYCQPTASVLQ